MKIKAKKPRRPRAPSPDALPSMLESLLFVADEPTDVGVLARSLNVKLAQLDVGLAALEGACCARGVRLQRKGDLVQLVTAPDAAPYVERFLGMEHQQRLSTAALESLAIVAYKQPITRAGIESIRGVNSDRAVATLVARGLVEEVGRASTAGHPPLLGTTLFFLEYFGLQRPEDLPAIEGVSVDGGEEAEG